MKPDLAITSRCPRSSLSSRRALHALLPLVLGGVMPTALGCAGPPVPEDRDVLWQHFPDQAATVLSASNAFVARGEGFALDDHGDIAAALDVRGGLSAALPASAEGEARFHLTGGFEARVREIGAAGPGALVEHAVAYAREGGKSYWSATEQGCEEWLLLGEGQAKRDQPVAAWEVTGAVLQQEGEAVVLADESGVTRLRVTAPAAYKDGGQKIAARLTVHGPRIELSVDADGEAVLVDPVWSVASSMVFGRTNHAATLLTVGPHQGNVLAVGGTIDSGPDGVERYDPADNTWHLEPVTHEDRVNHTATVLNDGRVLVTGGCFASDWEASAEVYDPMNRTWTLVAPMSTPRCFHTATLLQTGRVLVVGGFNQGTYLSSAELYDPVGNHWTAAGNIVARTQHTATLLHDGRVLVAGG